MNKHNWQEQNAYKMHIVANGSVPKKNIKGKLSFQLVPSDDLRRHFLPLESSNDSQPKMVLSIKKIFILLGVSGEDLRMVFQVTCLIYGLGWIGENQEWAFIELMGALE